MQGALFGYEDRFPVPINEIALPSDICIFGNHFGENTYYADFAGIAKKYKAQAIMEIGVRFGYSGIAMCLGALASGHQKVWYYGCDGEFFGAEFNHSTEGQGFYRSNAIAAENFRRFIPQVSAEFFGVDTQKQPLPVQIVGGTDPDELPPTVTYTPWKFDLINVDGDHSWVGAYSDCKKVWPLLNVGGILLVDDMSMAEVGPAVHHFIKEIEDQNGADAIVWQMHHNERDMMFIRRNS
jgi:hypothetical protein